MKSTLSWFGFSEDELELPEKPIKTTNKPDISVGYILKQFDLTNNNNLSQEKRSNSDFVVLTDKDDIEQKRKKRQRRVNDENEENYPIVLQ